MSHHPAAFKISSVTLTIEPAEEVPRNTNVTLRCQTKVLTSGNLALTRKYTIFKENRIVHTKMTESSDDVLYLLPEARVSNNGKYVCQLTIEGETLSSQPKKLKVMGRSVYSFLHIKRNSENNFSPFFLHLCRT